jgi:hypothetical protein
VRAKKKPTRAKATRPKKRTRTAQKSPKKNKPPVGAKKPTGGAATRAKGSTRKVSGKPKRPVKLAPKPLPKPKPKPKRRLSKHPEAARSRRRRGLLREQKRQAELKREAQNRKRREARERKKRPPSETDLARGWLEMIRERIADVFNTALSITIPMGGPAREEDKERQAEAGAGAGNTPWMIVGRFDPTEEINYQILAMGLMAVANDLIIEAAINPQRLSQIRIVFADPTGARGEGDDVLSHIGAWEFVLGDAIGDLVGSNIESPDEGSLAARYKETTVTTFYVFFSSEIVRHVTAWQPGAARTQEVKIKR